MSLRAIEAVCQAMGTYPPPHQPPACLPGDEPRQRSSTLHSSCMRPQLSLTITACCVAQDSWYAEAGEVAGKWEVVSECTGFAVHSTAQLALSTVYVQKQQFNYRYYFISSSSNVNMFRNVGVLPLLCLLLGGQCSSRRSPDHRPHPEP